MRLIKKLKENMFFISMVSIILMLGFANSLGCCVSSDQQTCSKNSEKTSCEQYGGTFFVNDVSCTSQTICDSGCCMLGLDSARMTRGQCQTETVDRGFSALNFIKTTENCNKYISSQEWGACNTLNSLGKQTCRFVTRTQCIGSFLPNTLCSSVTSSPCNKTQNQICFANDVYLIDSCGNRDELVKTCDYDSGKVCEQTSAGTNSVAECIDASCLDNFDYSSFVVDELYLTVPSFSSVNRNPGESWCVTNGNVPLASEEVTRDLNRFGNAITTAAGLKFFSRYCTDGKILMEECGDEKEEYCSGQSNSLSGSSSGTGGKCTNNEWRDCLNAETEEDCDSNSCVWFSPVMTDLTKENIDDLEISKCLPKIPAGSSDYKSSSSLCSQGSFESEYKEKGVSLIVSPTNNFVLLNPSLIAFLDYRCSRIADCTGKISWVGTYGRNSSNGVDYQTKDEVLNEIDRRGISFAEGKNSGAETVALLKEYLSSPTGIESYDLANYPKNKYPVVYGDKDSSFEYTCTPRKAPLNADCTKCNAEGSACTKYSCEAIGQNCEYSSTSGTCENKGDLESPSITVNCPDSSTIGIQKPVSINVSTSEISYCKFSIGSATANYDLMSYDFGNTWTTDHKVLLSIPGSNSATVGGVLQYPLITRSGNFDVFIRCVDPKGNGDSESAKLCSFTVPRTPDRNPPVVLKMTPTSDSPIAFNTSSKTVIATINEPAECRWAVTDIDYDLMNKNFNCSDKPVFMNEVSGYNCEANLTGITRVVGNISKFYIRCKDQPYLVDRQKLVDYMLNEGYTGSEIDTVLSGAYSEEQLREFMQSEGYLPNEIDTFIEMYTNMESSTYYRMKSPQSKDYSLKASAKLEISEVTPTKRVTLGPSFASWPLTVKTIGGGYNGATDCRWSLNYKNSSTAYSDFQTYQSTSKSQTIDQLTEGDYFLSVICTDKAENRATYEGSLEIRYDRTAPLISRVYNDKGNFKLTTNEPAICKFTNVLSMGMGCAFTISHPNLTLMLDSSVTEHGASWKKGSSYFVKCQDFYGNENSICGVIAKAI